MSRERASFHLNGLMRVVDRTWNLRLAEQEVYYLGACLSVRSIDGFASEALSCGLRSAQAMPGYESDRSNGLRGVDPFQTNFSRGFEE